MGQCITAHFYHRGFSVGHMLWAAAVYLNWYTLLRWWCWTPVYGVVSDFCLRSVKSEVLSAWEHWGRGSEKWEQQIPRNGMCVVSRMLNRIISECVDYNAAVTIFFVSLLLAFISSNFGFVFIVHFKRGEKRSCITISAPCQGMKCAPG